MARGGALLEPGRKPTGGTDVGGYEYQTFTAGLNWLPTDRVDILAQIYLSDDEITPSAVSSLTLNCENTVAPSAQASAYPDNRFLAWCGTVPNMEQTNAQLGIGDDKVINNFSHLTQDTAIGHQLIAFGNTLQ